MDDLFKRISTARIYKPVPKFPAIKRDVAVVVKDELPVKHIERAIIAAGGELVESVRLFDVYKGQGVEDGYKSVAYSITFRAPDRTLVDAEVAGAFSNIMAGLESQLGAKIRA